MNYRYEIETDLGTMILIENENKISHIGFSTMKKFLEIPIKKTILLEMAEQQILEYFEGKRQNFSLPIAPKGTIFQKKVWKALQNIPYGQTRCYKEIAKEIGQCKAARAVGNANHNNPIAIVIPCHRVIGANGKLTGYYSGIDKKEFLLKLEGAL
ncbi:methylated-DNA--[protein]-cysteine S-methyltransferase [Lachnospiraceae bacterium 46-61]